MSKCCYRNSVSQLIGEERAGTYTRLDVETEAPNENIAIRGHDWNIFELNLLRFNYLATTLEDYPQSSGLSNSAYCDAIFTHSLHSLRCLHC